MLQTLQELWEEPTTRVVVGILLTCVVIASAVYLIQRVRGIYADDSRQLDDWASIQELKEDGTIREYEYHHLRKKIAAKYNEDLVQKETAEKNRDPEPPPPVKPDELV